ncbi:hypothetical protein [Caulobacter sp. NIBR2454]|uniref:hypothetical protein n=1 Tax=Caulobacter sp. NIBR2454 TaxID=3015996 RepID=UPI0022B727FA|nr:hypothetical protein [Caulobacter sp. NIBR2454]
MLTEDQRRKLARSLDELRNDGPIDNPQIARALIAIIETLLYDAPDEPNERRV